MDDEEKTFFKSDSIDEGYSKRFSDSSPKKLEASDLKEAENDAELPTISGDSKEKESLATKSGRSAESLAFGALSSTPQGRVARIASKALLALSNKKRTGIIGGIVGMIVAIIALVIMLASPALVVNHLREIITARMSSVQIQQGRAYRRSNIRKVSDLFSKDGRLGGSVIGEMENSGYKFKYGDASDANKVTGLLAPDRSGRTLEGIGNEIDSFMEQRHPFKTARWKTKRTEALYRRYGITRSSIVSAAEEALDDPDKAINQRIAQGVLDEPIDESVKISGVDEDQTDEANKLQEAYDTGDNAFSDLGNEIVETGDDVDTAAARQGIDLSGKAITEVGDGVGAEVLGTAERLATEASFGSKAFGAIKSFFNPTDILDRVCVIKGRLRMAVVAGRSYRALSLMKYASLFVGVGDGVRRGNVDGKLMNSVMKRINSADSKGNFIGASPGFSYALNGSFSKSRNSVQKGSYGVDGSLSGTWKSIQNGTNNVAGTSRKQCGVIQNPVFQVGSGLTLTFGKTILCVATLGAGCAAEGAAETVAREGIATLIKTEIQNSIRAVFTRQALRALAIGAATEISFEGIMMLTQLYIQKSFALPYTGQETGAELGSILTAGGGTANKQRSLQAGMVPATTTEYAEAHESYLAWKKEELKNQSLFDRYANINNIDSLAFNFATSLPMGFGAFSSSLPIGFSSGINSLLSGNIFSGMFGRFLGAKAFASDEVSFDSYALENGPNVGKQLAVDFAGNPQVIMRNNIASIDPQENIQFLTSNVGSDGKTYISPDDLEPLSDDFKNHIQDCVNEIDIISKIEFQDGDVDCLAQKKITRRFKAHLAYLDMVDGIEAEFMPEEISGGTPTLATNTSSYNQPVVGNTSNIPCTPGTQDLGPTTGYKSGEPYQIRLCGITELTSQGTEDTAGYIRVNSTASKQWLDLAQQAKSDGIDLVASSSFRSNDYQKRLYSCYITKTCNGGRLAAKPGYSNHQFGFAVDINIAPGSDPSLTTCQSNPSAYPKYGWLADNAAKYGISANVASECWHWSIGGN